MILHKKSFIILLTVLIIALLSACASEGTKTESKKGPTALDAYVNALDEDTKSDIERDKEFDNRTHDKTEESPISKDIRSYEIMIKDEVFKFPMTQEELSKTSFKYIGETALNEVTVTPGIKYEALYSNGESEVIFNLMNMGEEDISGDKAIVAGLFIQFDKENALNREDVILPHNIPTAETDLNSLKTIYGEPDEVYHDSQDANPKASKLIYRIHNGEDLYSYTIFVDNEKHQVREIIILSAIK